MKGVKGEVKGRRMNERKGVKEGVKEGAKEGRKNGRKNERWRKGFLFAFFCFSFSVFRSIFCCRAISVSSINQPTNQPTEVAPPPSNIFGAMSQNSISSALSLLDDPSPSSTLSSSSLPNKGWPSSKTGDSHSRLKIGSGCSSDDEDCSFLLSQRILQEKTMVNLCDATELLLLNREGDVINDILGAEKVQVVFSQKSRNTLWRATEILNREGIHHRQMAVENNRMCLEELFKTNNLSLQNMEQPIVLINGKFYSVEQIDELSRNNALKHFLETIAIVPTNGFVSRSRFNRVFTSVVDFFLSPFSWMGSWFHSPSERRDRGEYDIDFCAVFTVFLMRGRRVVVRVSPEKLLILTPEENATLIDETTFAAIQGIVPIVDDYLAVVFHEDQCKKPWHITLAEGDLKEFKKLLLSRGGICSDNAHQLQSKPPDM